MQPNILDSIASQYSSLTRSSKKLADYMQENGAGVPAGSNIMEMAQMTIQRLSQSSLEYRQEHLLLNLLRDSDTSATDEELQAAKLQLEGPYYRAAILRVKAFPEEEWPQGVHPPELSEYIPLLQQIFSAEKTCYIVEYMERNCFILVFSEKSSDPEECSSYLQKCTNLLNESCLQGFLYVGNAYSTLDLLRQSFHEAKTAFVNRNIQKETTVYFYGIHPSDDSIYQQTYPTADLDALCNAIDQDNPMLVEFMSTELQRHIEHIAGDSFTVRCVCYEAINRIFQTMDKKSPGWMKRACGDIVNNLSISSVEDLKLVLQTLCSQVILDIKAKPERPQKLSMKDATAYIDCHFCDPDFSVKSLAADYKMSVSNFSHQFKTYTGKTVSDYINHKKIQYAKELLRETGGSVAEVASTVNENLMIEQLLKKEQDPAARLVLLNQYLENFKGTVYRQTMFAEFEREAHAMRERGEALSPAALGALYGKLVQDYFGPDLVMDEEVGLEWARIPHFYRPFYVYKYATGYSTAVALSEAILREGQPAVKRYLEFLSMGGSAYPLDELRHAGVDLMTPAPIDAALDKFDRLLADAEACADKLGR